MINILNNQNNDVLEAEFTETFTQSDLEHLVPVIEKHVAESNHPRIIIIMNEFGGWDKAGTFFKDFKLDIEYSSSFEKVAVVGDKKWEEWLTKLIYPFMSPEIKFFDKARAVHARKWVEQ